MNNERSNSERVLSGAGILMTVFGALETVLFLVYVGVLVYVSKKAGNVFSATEALLSGALFLFAALTELIAGILGFRSVKTGGRATAGMIFAALSLAASVAALILMGGMDLLTTVSLIVCAVVPVIYLTAAIRVRRDRRKDA